MFNKDYIKFLPVMVWVVGLFLIWYGFIICWIVPIYYRSLRSRVLLEQSLWRKVLSYIYRVKGLQIVTMKNNRFLSQKRFYSIYNSDKEYNIINSSIVRDLVYFCGFIDTKIEELRVLWIRIEDLIKIQKILGNGVSKKVIKRHYSNLFFNEGFNSDSSLQKFFNGLWKDHEHNVITVMEGVSSKDEILEESIIVFKNRKKEDWTQELTKELSSSDNMNKIEKKLNLMVDKGNINITEKKLILSNKQVAIPVRSLEMKKGEKIKMIAIQNLTTSPKNASEIIGPGILSNLPVNNGIYVFNNNAMIFLMQNKEEYRKVILILALLYRPDLHNQYNLLLKKKELDIVAEGNMYGFMKDYSIENINFLKFKDSKELNSNNQTVFGHLLEEYKNVKW